MSPTLSIRSAIARAGLVPIDAYVLLGHVLKRNRAWLIAHADDALSPEETDAFFALARRRRDGEPVAYLTGVREFWGLSLRVSAAVLIPRPETETLVEVALAHLPKHRPTRVLDLGTGSGALALAIAHERPNAHVVATDVSPHALDIARENARALSIVNVQWLRSDWYAQLPRDHDPFDVIVSNPPYVEAGDAHLGQGDVRYEPAHALTPGVDGLLALRRIIAEASSHLLEGGCIAVEHGYGQAEAARRLFAAAGYGNVRTARDLAGIERVTYGVLASSEGAGRHPDSV